MGVWKALFAACPDWLTRGQGFQGDLQTSKPSSVGPLHTGGLPGGGTGPIAEITICTSHVPQDRGRSHPLGPLQPLRQALPSLTRTAEGLPFLSWIHSYALSLAIAP